MFICRAFFDPIYQVYKQFWPRVYILNIYDLDTFFFHCNKKSTAHLQPRDNCRTVPLSKR